MLGSRSDWHSEGFLGICYLDDIATLAANIDKLGISERFVRNHPHPANTALAPDALKLDFDLLHLGVHHALLCRYYCISPFRD